MEKRKEVLAGAIFVAFGMIYGINAAMKLRLGSALNMGPGFFPIILSCILVALGLAIAIRGYLKGERRLTPMGFAWRPLAILSAATLCFGFFLDDLGMFPTLILTVFLAVHASPGVPLLRSAFIALGIAAFCTLIFSYLVRLPVPVIGPALM